MMPKFVLLWTDLVAWLLVLGMVLYVRHVRSRPNLAANWRKVFRDPAALSASVILVLCLVITLVDSIHYRRALPPAAGTAPGTVAYEPRTRSALDAVLGGLIESREKTYSRPLAYESFTKESIETPSGVQRLAPRLVFGGAHLKDPHKEWASDVAVRTAAGLVVGLGLALAVLAAWVAYLARRAGVGWRSMVDDVVAGRTETPWRAAFITVLVLAGLAGPTAMLMGHYHVFGTDRTGNDVLYQALKSVRTAFVIGSLATLATLPIAIGLGVLAGYFRGWVDDVIQYLYTVLSSVPNVLLIAACVLMIQVFLDKHPDLFETGAERSDIKLFLLCAVLGLTGWTGLCRLVRAEAMKLRELEFVQAAHAFGVSHARIMRRHLVPNVAHLVLITTVLEFSSLILYEAVLTYVGVGVDPTMNSFGGMINLARSEMSRDPVVWWSFAAAFLFMVTVVLAANLFADGVREAFDPRARVFRARLQPRAAAKTAAA